MDWTRIDQIDPHLLLGIVNTALRNDYNSLKDLCLSQDIQQEKLESRLAEVSYAYQIPINQFR